MKIIFIYNLAVQNPLFLELVHRLQNTGHQVKVYDFISSKEYDPLSKTISYLNPYWWANWILKIRYIRRAFIPLINKKWIKKEFKSGDIINIHYVHPGYIQYVNPIKSQNCRIITTFWGSDYLRTSDRTKASYHNLLENSDLITMVRGVKDIFLKEYGEYAHKVKVTFFGLRLLDVIKHIRKEDIIHFKKKHGVGEKKIITLGYNGSPNQQHLKLFDLVQNLSPDIKFNIHLFIPLTYGGSQKYLKNIKTAVKTVGVTFTLFEDRLSDVELAAMRCASDIVINIQKTDAFSGSISESIAAGSVVIVGEWLPYDIYNEWGIKIKRCTEDTLLKTVEDTLKQLENRKDYKNTNRQIIESHLSWPSTIKIWDGLYSRFH